MDLKHLINWLHYNYNGALLRVIQTTTMKLFAKKISNFDLKLSVILVKRSNLDISLCWNCLCTVGVQNTSYNSNGDISLIVIKSGIVLLKHPCWKFTTVNCLNISWQLIQLLIVFGCCRSQKYLLRKFSANYHQSIHGGVYFSKNPYFQHYLMKKFRRIRLKYEN